MVIASHDLDLVLDVCSRVLFLKDGALFGESALPGLLNDEAFLRQCGLRLPLSLSGRRETLCCKEI